LRLDVDLPRNPGFGEIVATGRHRRLNLVLQIDTLALELLGTSFEAMAFRGRSAELGAHLVGGALDLADRLLQDAFRVRLLCCVHGAVRHARDHAAHSAQHAFGSHHRSSQFGCGIPAAGRHRDRRERARARNTHLGFVLTPGMVQSPAATRFGIGVFARCAASNSTPI
jgi:hypothetical protein